MQDMLFVPIDSGITELCALELCVKTAVGVFLVPHSDKAVDLIRFK